MKKYFFLPVFVIFSLLSNFLTVFAEVPAEMLAAKVPEADGKISMDLRGIDVVEALKILSTRGNLNMVIGGNIQGRVTLFLKDVDIEDALQIVLASSGLAYDKKGDILYIMTVQDYEKTYGESFIENKMVRVFKLKYAKAGNIAKSLEQAKTRQGKVIVDDASNSLIVMDKPESVEGIKGIISKLDQPVASRIFELKYAKAEDMKAKIAEMLTKDVGLMEIDARTNKISVIDIKSRLNEIEKMVKAFDEKPRQVLIEAKIVQVTLNDEYKLGVDWQSVFNRLSSDPSVRTKFSIAEAGTFPTGFTSGGEVSIGAFGDDYGLLVQALKTVGDTNLLSSPRITALNNQEAKILVGESRPYATNTVVTPAAGATTTASTLSFLDIGIKLFVTPSISQDGFITMKIKPEVSSSSSNYTYGSPATTVPIVSTTQAETSVRVKNGSTIIIAGLIKDERTGDVSKIPLAGDVPVIGNAFKKTEKSVSKQELVIFITSHIISGEYDNLETPRTPPMGEERFTLSENGTFERRDAKSMDPTYFKDQNITPPALGAVTKITNPSSAEEYYYAVKDRILNHLDLKKSSPGSFAKGDIQVSFRIASTGELASTPVVKRTTNADLVKPALNAVRASAPFPPFPTSLARKEKDFTMDFVFE